MAGIQALAVAGGGTGGHLFPGLAIAEEFRRRDEGVRIMYVGVRGKLEERVVPQAGMEFCGLTMKGLKGQGPAGMVAGAWLAGRALSECRRALAAFRPDLLVGVGGYSSGPAALAARSLGVPLVLQEQNTVPGMTNRLLGRLARKIFLAFESAEPYFPPGRTVVTGNPIRRESLGAGCEVGEGEKLKVLVLGGSRGAQGVNRLVTAAAAANTGDRSGVVFVHQAGEEDRDWVDEAYRRAGIEAEVRGFIEGMGARYDWADLVVSRAGAGAVSEIAASGRPALLIPYPHSAGGHQHLNARWLQERGGAVIVEEADQEAAAKLAALFGELSGDRSRLRAMAAKSRKAGRRDAAANIVEICSSMMDKRRG